MIFYDILFTYIYIYYADKLKWHVNFIEQSFEYRTTIGLQVWQHRSYKFFDNSELQ